MKIKNQAIVFVNLLWLAIILQACARQEYDLPTATISPDQGYAITGDTPTTIEVTKQPSPTATFFSSGILDAPPAQYLLIKTDRNVFAVNAITN